MAADITQGIPIIDMTDPKWSSLPPTPQPANFVLFASYIDMTTFGKPEDTGGGGGDGVVPRPTDGMIYPRR